MYKCCCIITAGMLALASPVMCATTEEAVGARPSGMGEAFVGISDDGNALHYNPAGITFLNHHDITAMHADLFGLGIDNNYLAYTYPITGRLAVGADWFNMGFKDSELGYGFNRFDLGLGVRFLPNASVGATLKFLNTSTDFDGQTLGRGNGMSGDIGFMYKWRDRVSFGLVVNNLFNAEMTYDNGARARYYDQEAVAGVGVRPIKNSLVGLDIGDRLHLGSEYVIRDILALRLGLQRDLKADPEYVYSFGTGVRVKGVQFDYSLTDYPHLNPTSRISASLFFNFGYALVTLDRPTPVGHGALFPTLWKSYQQSPFMAFELESRSDQALECEWEVQLAGVLDVPSTGRVILRPREKKLIPVTADFSGGFFASPVDRSVQGTIRVTFSQGRESKSVSREFRQIVYGRGAIDWSDDVNWVASFINSQDPRIRDLASRFRDLTSTEIEATPLLARIYSALAVFSGLEELGIQYLADPNNPYALISDSSGALDNIQYPAELLSSRRGDCDDLTVLYCSLLESMGIETAVIDVPGHLFMMFDAGVPYAYRIALSCDERLLVSYQGRVFIPIEVTRVGNGFLDAWRVGAELFARWRSLGEANIVDIHSAWRSYPPPPASIGRFAATFDGPSTAVRVNGSCRNLKQEMDEYLEGSFKNPITHLASSPDVLNEAAIRRIFAGDYAEGEELLRSALQHDESRIDISGNLACVLALQGGYDEALALFQSLDPGRMTRDLAVNHILTACLQQFTGESEKGSAERLRAIVDRYHAEGIIAVGFPEVEGCRGRAENAESFAHCVRDALGTDEKLTEPGRKGNEDLDRAIDEKVRLFLWQY